MISTQLKERGLLALVCYAVVAVMGLMLPAGVVAGSAEAGAVVSILENDKLVLIRSDGERAQVPACAEQAPAWWVIDVDTVAGQEQLRELKALQASEKRVRIVGTGKCHDRRTAEIISFFYPVGDNPMVPTQ